MAWGVVLWAWDDWKAEVQHQTQSGSECLSCVESRV